MNLAIGQYDSYTNIELNQYIATLANGNNRYSLHFLKDIKNGEEIIKTYEPNILNNLEIISLRYFLFYPKSKPFPSRNMDRSIPDLFSIPDRSYT